MIGPNPKPNNAKPLCCRPWRNPRRLGPSVAGALERLGLQGPHAGEVMALLARHYQTTASWADAKVGAVKV